MATDRQQKWSHSEPFILLRRIGSLRIDGSGGEWWYLWLSKLTITAATMHPYFVIVSRKCWSPTWNEPQTDSGTPRFGILTNPYPNLWERTQNRFWLVTEQSPFWFGDSRFGMGMY
jgi:hypothetical protein